jgi:hypothetical protein
MISFLITALETLNQILTAGIAITAFSLLIYALSFNLQDRVARSFALILTCVVVVFTGDAFSSIAETASEITFWLRFQWVGIALLPPAYFHFSDALLEKTGRPSRGRRRLIVRIAYLLSLLFLATLPFSLLVGPLVIMGQPAPYLERTWMTWVFSGYYIAGLTLSWVNFWRAFKRTVLPTSRRRLRYLLTGALAPALGSFPYLLFGPSFAADHAFIFWMTAFIANLMVTALIVIMAYSVAFFGVPWPDRVVKRRLLKWLLRGPVTASTVLALVTLLSRATDSLGLTFSALVPVIMVITILLLEHLITLAAPVWERYLFQGGDQSNLRLVQTLEERILTTDDLRQFLDAVLAAVCDQLQSSTAFLASFNNGSVEFVITVGNKQLPETENLSQDIIRQVSANGKHQRVLSWGSYWLLPLVSLEREELLGLLGVARQDNHVLDEDLENSLVALGNRAALALEDRRVQQQVFTSLKDLSPQVELIQRLRAAAQYDQQSVLSDLETLPFQGDLFQPVKGALSHYWGGPKLTESPLLGLQIVQQRLAEHNNNPVNTLRSILRQAIDRVRPDGDRRFTAEWILYNILEMKFLEGRKVREVALRLAMSEADLYRKQRVAIEEVAKAVADMEKKAREEIVD